MSVKKYNGWTNYETWLAKLWMGNDEGSYSYFGDLAQQAYENAFADATFTKSERAALDLDDLLKEEHEEAAQNMLEASGCEASVFSDLLGAALSEVNWHEIAVSLLEDLVNEYGEELEEV